MEKELMEVAKEVVETEAKMGFGKKEVTIGFGLALGIGVATYFGVKKLKKSKAQKDTEATDEAQE